MNMISQHAYSPKTLRAWLGQVREDVCRRTLSPIARKVLARELTYLSARKLHSLERCAREMNRRDVPGDFVECGVALGGSTIVLASYVTGGRRLEGYDVFGMIPAPSERDDPHSHHRYEVIRSGQSTGIGDGRYYGYIDSLYDVVVANFREFGFAVDGRTILLHQGLFEDTMRFPAAQKIALAHIDCDWHDAVEFCLETVYRNLSPGGVIILDDYKDYGGCRVATDAFLAAQPDMQLRSTRGNAVLCRRPAAH